MLVLSGPSGTGKTTLAKGLLELDEHITTSVSVTTREKRPGEVEGQDYYFVDTEKFNQMIESGDFLEYAEVFGYLYGTPKKIVRERLDNGEDMLFDIEWQGHRQLVTTARTDLTSVFLLPPSKQALWERLQRRQHGLKDTPEVRIKYADDEMSHWHEYDYVIINKDIDDSLHKLHAILKAERLRKERRIGLPEFVGSILRQSTV